MQLAEEPGKICALPRLTGLLHPREPPLQVVQLPVLDFTVVLELPYNNSGRNAYSARKSDHLTTIKRQTPHCLLKLGWHKNPRCEVVGVLLLLRRRRVITLQEKPSVAVEQ